jgi:hypothetical protein
MTGCSASAGDILQIILIGERFWSAGEFPGRGDHANYGARNGGAALEIRASVGAAQEGLPERW